MFERYTERARRAIFFARYECSQLGSPFIEPEHMLLGLLREDKVLFARLLPQPLFGSSMSEEIRAGLEKRAEFPTSVDLPLSNASERILAYAAEEAAKLPGRPIEPAHLLLGVIRVPSAVSPILKQYGFTLESVRERIAEVPGGFASSGITFDRLPDALSALRASFETAVRRLTPEVEPALTFVPRRPQ